MTAAALHALHVAYDSERSDMARTTTTPKNRHAQALGRLGGAAGTKAQDRARKQNAQRAGRPKRVCIHCGKPVVAGHADRTLDETCGAHGWRWLKRHAVVTRAMVEQEIANYQRAIAQLRDRLKTLPKE